MPQRLREEECVPCRDGAAPLEAAGISVLWKKLPDWSVASKGGVRRLEKTFPFKDFAEAMAFASRVGRMADAQDHHPALLVEWGRVTVSWWTHRVKGLHRNDFICAAKTDVLAKG